MNMTVYKPFESLFDGSLNFARDHRSCFEGDFPVRMDMVENKEGFVIFAELPGMEKSDIKLSVENGILTISGERKRDENDDSRRVLSERFFGSFKRSFRLNDFTFSYNFRYIL